MKDILFKMQKKDFEKLQKLIADFESYYQNDTIWSFENLDEQREIALEIVEILKILKEDN
jgi:hypothetical protein